LDGDYQTYDQDETEDEPEEETREANTHVRDRLEVTDNLRSEDEPMTVYLTFDDGPSENTPEILEILKKHNVKATFFVTGKEGDQAKEWYQQIVADGHTLGMHSYSHSYSTIYESVDSFDEDFTELYDYLKEVTGVSCEFYRFPGGSSNQVSNTDMNEFIDYLGEKGMTYYDWNVVCGDATSQIYSADELVENVMTDVVKYKYSVVLMHDAAEKDTTVEALEKILQELEEMDAVILPITEDSPVIHHNLASEQ
jgi:peptidoglycan/xylan/chitin deacetylase (PgdA/CDA1 family)